ncbi:MAG: heparan-alpha-glucosaminide N-acetyltransferase domain-containing protein [Dermatophilaceae bacterium]
MTSTLAPPLRHCGAETEPEHLSPPGDSRAPHVAPLVTVHDAMTFPHQCDPNTLRERRGLSPRGMRSRVRLVGLDAARGIALIGMIAVHTFESTNDAGDMSLAWVLASGKASALFAVLAGVGLAFMTGRTRPPRGRDALRAATIPLVRGALIVIIGLVLGGIVDVGDASVVLAYLGVMFVMAAVVVPLRARSLLVVGFAWAIVGPILSHLLRQGSPAQAPVNLGLGSLADPLGTLQVLVLTGVFPALTWFAYICLGMALGRADLASRLVVAKMLAGGVLLTLMTSVASSILVGGFGLRERLADSVNGTMTLETFTEYLVFGDSGSLPTTSWWWLGVLSPHSGTPLDLLFTMGTSLAVIGACLALAQVFGHRFLLLAVPGGMTLTLYSLHLLLLGPLRGFPDGLHFAVQLTLLVTFALIWGEHFRRGPMERMLTTLTRILTPRRPSAGTSQPGVGSPGAIVPTDHVQPRSDMSPA